MGRSAPRAKARPAAAYPGQSTVFISWNQHDRKFCRTVRTEPVASPSCSLAPSSPASSSKSVPTSSSINAGLKSEGIVPIEQFKNEKGELEINVGDEVKVALDAIENGFGETDALAREGQALDGVGRARRSAIDKDETITGRISGKVKGGFTVDIKDVRAFLPGSLVDVRPVRDPSYLEGKELEFKIIKLDRKRNNVVVSRRAVVESEFSEEREKLLERLQEGAVVKGVVKNLTDYGAFVDLGGIDGLLHITDMAWKRVRHPSEVVNVGDELDVRVLKYDRERNRVSLGLKQLGEDPWVAIARRYPTGTPPVRQGLQRHRLRLLRRDRAGRRRPGPRVRDGLDQQERQPGQGRAGRRRSRSHGAGRRRRASPHLARHQADARQSVGSVRRDPQEGRQGLRPDQVDHRLRHLHRPGRRHRRPGPSVRHLAGRRTGEDLVRNFKKGDEIEAVVLAVDPERERISLGIKQIEQDPFGQFMAANPRGSILNGTVKEVDAKGATIDLGEGVEGYLRANDIAKERVDDATPAPEGRRQGRSQVHRHGSQGPPAAALDPRQGRRRDAGGARPSTRVGGRAAAPPSSVRCCKEQLNPEQGRVRGDEPTRPVRRPAAVPNRCAMSEHDPELRLQ